MKRRESKPVVHLKSVTSDATRVLRQSGQTLATLPSDVSKADALFAARALRVKLLTQLGRDDEIPVLPHIGPGVRRPSIGVGLLLALALVLGCWRKTGRWGSTLTRWCCAAR
jgi:hypothetical protein